jgi:hypothetical protein
LFCADEEVLAVSEPIRSPNVSSSTDDSDHEPEDDSTESTEEEEPDPMEVKVEGSKEDKALPETPEIERREILIPIPLSKVRTNRTSSLQEPNSLPVSPAAEASAAQTPSQSGHDRQDSKLLSLTR